MVSKVDLQRWQKACHAFDNQHYSKALDTLLICCPSSKTYFNIGVILISLHDYQHALNGFAKAVDHDPYFSAAYFQSGVANIMLGNFGLAVKCFDLAYKTLRGNKAINYRQLGLDFILYACEILYNRGMCHIYLDNATAGMDDLYQAQQLKMTQRHCVIDQAAQDTEHSTFGVYSIPSGVIYRPREYQLQLLTQVESSSLHNYYSFASLELLFLNKQYQHGIQKKPLHLQQQQKSKQDNLYQHYRHIPKYVSKYLSAVITKDKINMASSKPLPSITMSQHPPFSAETTHVPQLKQGAQHSNRSAKPTHNDPPPPCDSRIKLKIHYKDTRILMVNADTPFGELWVKVHEKLNEDNHRLLLHIKNAVDGTLTPIMNDEGWAWAKTIHSGTTCKRKSIAKSRSATKVELWCTSMES